MPPLAQPAGHPHRPLARTVTPVTLTAESNSNSVLVRGPADQVPSVVEMIKRLDDSSTASSSQVRVYPLTNSQAGELVPILTGLFGRTRPPRQEAIRPRAVHARAVHHYRRHAQHQQPRRSPRLRRGLRLLEQLLSRAGQGPGSPGPGRRHDASHCTTPPPADVATKVNAMYKDRHRASKPARSSLTRPTTA